MATTKPQKDKLFPVTPAPKLVPRPTAASTARAALNASNRNLNMTNMPLAQRTSPNRASTSPNLKRKNSTCQRSLPDTQTKPDPHMDTKINTSTLQERVTNIDYGKMDKNFESQLFHEPPSIISEDSQEEFQQDNGSDIDNNNYDENIESDAHYSDDKLDSVDTGNRDVKLVEPVIVSSQPQTPFPSRPHTPKSLARTRTSAGGSRPSTPSTISSLRHTTPISRPTTPQRSHIKPRPNSNLQTPQPDLLNARVSHEITPQPNIPFETFINLTNDTLQLIDNGDVKSVYAAKQKQFQQMKKELDLKQQAVLELFEHLRSLRERMPQESESGGGEGALQELLMFNVADWPAEEVAQLCHEAVSTDGAVQLIESMPVDECTLNEVESKIQSIPELFGELCLEAFSARQELIDWVKELLHRNCLQESGEGETVQRIANYNLQGHQLCDALRELKDRADSAVHTFSSVSKRVWRDQNALMSVGKSLVRDIARLKQDLGVHSNIINEMRQERSETGTNSLDEARQELEEERTAKNSLKEKLTLAEYQLRQSRVRITKMDRQLHEAEASITTLTSTVKSLEDQSRQRDALVESRARKLKESVKMGEVASGHLAQQRDALQAEVTELKDQIEKLTNQHKSSIRDLKNQLKETKSALDEQRQTNHNKELELRAEKDAALAESQATVHRLEAKIKELENKTEQNLPTPREMELLAEVQATKVALRLVEEEVVVCKREKVRFLETLTKIADSENKVGMQQKLAAELLSKEDVIAKMQIQMREVIKNDKLLEQKVIQYERYISDLQAYNTEINNAEYCNETKNQDLQKEILDLRMKLLEAVHRNEELTEALGQKDQQLDQQDKTSRAQARVIKVREELINMLKSKETEQSRELSALQQDLEHRMKIVDEVNKQIAAKAVEIQELFATLESKQQQIHRLEKIVLALEEQQRRAQAQRTRYEEKIAALEHELAAGGYRRERKFLFF